MQRLLLACWPLLVAGCSATTESLGPLVDPEVVHGRRLADALSGQWTLESPDGEAVGSFHLQRGAAVDMVASFVPAPSLEGEDALPEVGLTARVEGSMLKLGGGAFELELEAERVLGQADAHSQRRLEGILRIGWVLRPVVASHVNLECPVCATAWEDDPRVCGVCGMNLRTPQVHDLQVRESPGSLPFDPLAFTEGLQPLGLPRTHLLVLDGFDLRPSQDDSLFLRVLTWAFVGFPTAWLPRTFEVRCDVAVDLREAVALEDRLELDFFERHEGVAEPLLFAVSFLAPTTVLGYDEDLVSAQASRRLGALVRALVEEGAK